VRVIVRIHLGQRLGVDALTTLVCIAIDGVTPISSPVLGHSCARCSGRAHMKSSTRGRGRRARACVKEEEKTWRSLIESVPCMAIKCKSVRRLHGLCYVRLIIMCITVTSCSCRSCRVCTALVVKVTRPCCRLCRGCTSQSAAALGSQIGNLPRISSKTTV
jgi:hypothetical protein